LAYQLAFPAIAADSYGGFLVAWNGNHDIGGMVAGELEIIGQRLGPATLFADGFESGDASAWSNSSSPP
jgi:hypothetical protein